MKTVKEFEAAMGRPPEDDDMERVNCPDAGKILHTCCGWCEDCDRPMFACQCSLDVRALRYRARKET